MSNALSEVSRSRSDTASTDILRMKHEFSRLFESDPDGAQAAFLRGLIAFREGRHGAAAEAFRRAIELQDANADYHFYLAGCSVALGRIDDAISSYRAAIRIHPDFSEAHMDFGRLLTSQGQLDQAAVCFRAATRINPDYADAYADLANVLRAQGKFDEAGISWEQAAHLNPHHHSAQKGLAETLMRRGKPDQAILAYQCALQIRPEDAETLNDLGIVLARSGDHRRATDCYREALRLQPQLADAHNNLGNALRNLGQLDESIHHLKEAVRLRPSYPEGYNNLAIALRRKGLVDEAIHAYQQALQLRPTYAEAHNNLGFAWASRGRHDMAIACYQQAIRIKPDYVEAIHNLGNAHLDANQPGEAEHAYRNAIQRDPRDPRFHKSLANALSRLNRFDDAIGACREAIRLHPDFAEAYNDLGIHYSRLNKHEEAIASYEQALRLRPDYAEVHNNLGNSLRNMGKLDASIESHQRAISLKPNYADAHNNLGISLSDAGRFDEAVQSYTRCLELRPNHVDAHMNRALTWLRKGDFAQGWAEYEWGWRKRAMSSRPLIQPLWNGFPLEGRTILLIAEQGLGDSLQFVRYAPLLKARGARVIFECPERLMKLLERTDGIDQLIAQNEPLPPHDVHAPLLTLPGLLATGGVSIPAEVPYVHADPQLVDQWRTEFAGIRELKVGINWQGNPQYGGDRNRSIPLAYFAALARVPGVRLYSLQKNHGLDQLKTFATQYDVVDLGSRLDEQTAPFMDTAAVLKNLDLFITSDTSVAHLAGALGVPVWMALSTTPDWRWRISNEACPWYPSMRIFRQPEHGAWRPVFDQMASELRKLVPTNLRASALRIRVAPGELIDKITILQIKSERIDDPQKLANVRRELEILTSSREDILPDTTDLNELQFELHAVNTKLWDIEDQIRKCESAGEFGPNFIELARSIYRINDRRAEIKRQINQILNSDLIEEKAYAAY